MPEAVSVFMLPPSFEELRRRIRNRDANDDPADVANRLRTARAEAAQYKEYDYVIINEVVEGSVELLRSILLAERARYHLLEAQVKPILESFE
jgi:guanylate kinase